jgi:Stress responsive A/B Barrel Domain
MNMKKATFSGILLAAVMIFMSFSTLKDDKAKPQFQRIVCFKFKAGLSAEAKTKHITDFAAFVKAVPQVLSYRAGKTVKGENKNDLEFDIMHYMTFEKEQDIVQYDAHPAHKKFVEANKDSWEKVIAVNGAIEK